MQLVMSSHVLHTRYATTSPTTSPSLTPTSPLTPSSSSWKENTALTKRILYMSVNVHNLTLKGQGQWPVAGAEETVMQSTVIINCTRGRGGFYFDTSYNITVEGLTDSQLWRTGWTCQNQCLNFTNIHRIFPFTRIQYNMTGFGLLVYNCDNVIITNCSLLSFNIL